MMNFTKMNGAGNDFVMLDNRDGALALDPVQIAHLCDRHRGIGADGLLVVESAQGDADFKMRYYNADGGEAEMCGNGARCFGLFAQKISGKTGDISFETLAGVITAQFIGTNVRIQMSAPHSLLINTLVNCKEQMLTVHSVNTGVPHAVVLVDDLQGTDVRSLGANLRHHAHFKPNGTNVNFVKQIGPQDIAIRTYERGVEDETLACGTGMVACALIFHELTGIAAPITVKVRGGDTLEVSFQKVSLQQKGAAAYRNVMLTGPADIVFAGQIAI